MAAQAGPARRPLTMVNGRASRPAVPIARRRRAGMPNAAPLIVPGSSRRAVATFTANTPVNCAWKPEMKLSPWRRVNSMATTVPPTSHRIGRGASVRRRRATQTPACNTWKARDVAVEMRSRPPSRRSRRKSRRVIRMRCSLWRATRARTGVICPSMTWRRLLHGAHPSEMGSAGWCRSTNASVCQVTANATTGAMAPSATRHMQPTRPGTASVVSAALRSWVVPSIGAGGGGLTRPPSHRSGRRRRRVRRRLARPPASEECVPPRDATRAEAPR